MTLPSFFKLTCGNCGYTESYIDFMSISSFDSPDLDTRPPENLRSAEPQYLVRRCKNCDYCNENIEVCPSNIKEILGSDEYKKQITNELFPEKANQFLCKSIILEANNDIENSAWAALHAAWICDDDEKYVQSKTCRRRAIELFELASKTANLSFEKNGEFPLLLIDLYRRTEQFEIAHKLCLIRLNIEKDDLFIKILHFQKSLISLQDIKGYSIDTAIIKYAEENIQEENSEVFEDELIDDNSEADSYHETKSDDYGQSYEKYGGYNDYSDDAIDDAFEGDPEATWNVD